MRPLAVDLYCCQGGASRGLDLAGFDVLGVDKDPQPFYPYEFVQADALAFLADLIGAGMLWHGRPVRLVAGSPPCQRRTKAQKIRGREHPKLIAPTRDLMVASGVAYVIENVPAEGEDDDPLIGPVMLCGAMFGLHTYRHRLFESNIPLTVPPHDYRDGPTVKMGRPLRDGDWYHAVGNFSGVGYVRRDLGAPWMNRDGLRECVPPVYAQFVGAQLIRHLAHSEVAA